MCEAEWRESGWELPICRLSFTVQLSACHHLQPNHFPLAADCFLLHHTNNPWESLHTHTHSYTHTHCISKKDVCWRLTAVFDSGSLHHVEFLPEETARRRLISHAARGGREGGEGRQQNSIIPAICQSKLNFFYFFFSNQTEHKQTQSCANESKWDVTVLLGLIY